MPTVYDSKIDLLNFSDLVKYTIDQSPYVYDGLVQQVNAELRAYPSLTVDEAWEQACVRILEKNGLNVERNANGGWTSSVFPNAKQVTDVANPLNSNSTVIKRGQFREMYGSIKQFDGSNQYMQVSRYPVSGGLGAKATYVVGSVGSAVAAASTGIWLGKTFDATLYNSNPEFFNSIGWDTLNPETWAMLTNGDDSPFAGLWNFILGVDGTNGTAQAYMREDMLAYLAYGLYQQGIFASTGTSYSVDDSVLPYLNINFSYPVYAHPIYEGYEIYNSGTGNVEYSYTSLTKTDDVFIFWTESGGQWTSRLCSKSPFSVIRKYHGTLYPQTLSGSRSNVTINNVQYPVYMVNSTGTGTLSRPDDVPVTGNSGFESNVVQIGYIIVYGTPTQHGGVDGIGNQEGATLPDTTGWDNLDNVLPSLQQQYPDAFQNPMVWNSDSPYDETGGNQTRYIPVPFPMANSATDTQPISGTQTQTNTSLTTTPQDIIDLITKTIQQTNTQPATPPANPTDTGTGSTPVPTAPTGSASALWSVYHPTQGEVNSFGAWLWGSPFLTNIGKLFQNPIEGVISLHKIFATPVDSGTGNIVVGTLDSGVSSATVNQQYVEVDCGSVTLSEDFGNVFDYDPYTKIALYLPFVGIVPLNVADIMRSTISVKYGVDVFTGACIAMVSVSRDGNSATLYQYTGNCAVHYPLSNVQQSQLLSGLITVAAGIGSIVATGGAATPAAVAGIATGAASALHSNIGRSGGFSANAGAMGIKIPYLIIERPQTKVADTFPQLIGYPTNYSIKLGDCSNHVVVKHVHVEGINATESELEQIESLLKTGVLV